MSFLSCFLAILIASNEMRKRSSNRRSATARQYSVLDLQNGFAGRQLAYFHLELLFTHSEPVQQQ